MAVRQIASEIPPKSTCVMIFPDRGGRYLDTIFLDQWVMKTLGGLPEEYLQSITSEQSNLRVASA
jgi:hypothetical protein